MIDKQKLALIHVARRALGMVDEDYRALLFRVAGVESSRDLDEAGFDLLLEEFRRLGFESDAYKAGFGERHWEMASAAQVHAIRRLWGICTQGEGSDKGLNTWIERQFKVGALRFLTKPQAGKAIAALKSWERRNADRSQSAA